MSLVERGRKLAAVAGAIAENRGAHKNSNAGDSSSSSASGNDGIISNLRYKIGDAVSEQTGEARESIAEKIKKKETAIQKLKIAQGASAVAWVGSIIFTAYNAVNLARGADGKRTHLFYSGAAIVTSYNGFIIFNNAREILENATDYLIDPPRDRNWNLKKVVPKLLKDTLFLQHLAKTNNSVAILAAQQLLGKAE